MKLIRAIGLSMLWLLCAAVALGFAGRLHPAADSLSLLRMPLGTLCLLAVVIRTGAVLRVSLLASGLAAAVTTVPLWLSAQVQGDLVVYSKNLWYRNAQLPALAADIISSGAEVVTLQEVSRRNDTILALLKDRFPHQHLCRFSGWSGIAVLSAHPIDDVACSSQRAVAAARIDQNGRSVWVASVHLKWPFPYAHEAAARSAGDLLRQLEGPIVMAGDFNIFPWASSVRDLNQIADLATARPIRPTFFLHGVPLQLDHVHAAGGGQVSYRPLLGSDHRGVLARVLP